MIQKAVLTDDEKRLLVQLLEQEQDELPPEIHHTRTRVVREELHQRAILVRQLLAKMHTPDTIEI
ncbi:MAG: hypothetical protein IT443_00240 [Phycisphaeraceae bacterium]|nr:hypothetical protein [Phycisphaeraceae bacterium]